METNGVCPHNIIGNLSGKLMAYPKAGLLGKGKTMAYTDSATCPECEREFDLFDLADAEEWFYGHDCEAE